MCGFGGLLRAHVNMLSSKDVNKVYEMGKTGGINAVLKFRCLKKNEGSWNNYWYPDTKAA